MTSSSLDGWTVVLAISSTIGGGSTASFRLRDGLRACGVDAYVVSRGGAMPRYSGDADFLFTRTRELLRWLRQHERLVVVPNWIWPIYRAAPVIGRRREIRVVGVCRSDAESYYSNLVRSIGTIDALVAVSRHCARVLEGRIAGAKVSVIPSPVDWSIELRRSYNTRPVRVGYAGRIESEHKRSLDLVPLLECCRGRGIDIRVEIAGEGAQLGELLTQLSGLRIPGVWRYVGAIHYDEARTFWARQDICLQLSDVEGLSLGLREAMAMGAVPVATRVSGIDEAITDKRDGFISMVGDIDALCSNLQRLSESPRLLEATGRAAHDRARDWSVESHTTRWLELLREVVTCREPVLPGSTARLPHD